MSTQNKKAIELACFYAHKDQALMLQLKNHLSILQRQGLISLWSDVQINRGAAWKEEINEHRHKTSVILLLVSTDFLATEYCYSSELKQAIERSEQGDTSVIPVVL